MSDPQELPSVQDDLAYLARWLGWHVRLLLTSSAFWTALIFGVANLVEQAMSDKLTPAAWGLNLALIVLTALAKGTGNNSLACDRAKP